MNFESLPGGQFQSAKGGQFESAKGGQLKSAEGGQFGRRLHFYNKSVGKTTFVYILFYPFLNNLERSTYYCRLYI